MLDFLHAIFEFFAAIGSADKSLTENSLLGETELNREARRSWMRLGFGCIALVVLGALTAIGIFLLWG
jgi:hypothetical protein|uniref:hypothetical protein n=1 Tax=Prosthecobacter sp. TaxID=1965333 RepID=UPI00378505F1